MTEDEPVRMHDMRSRAEAFGAVAEDYDRYRPSYPDALMDDLVAGRPTNALDVGCGTGKAARLLAARGVDVLGVEIDEDMAMVARRSGVLVEVGSFETWDPRGRTFDLVVSGQAWHWIDPALGVPKVAGLLRPGATLALFWNTVSMDEATRDLLRAAYARVAPDMAAVGRHLDEDSDPQYAADLRDSGLFRSVDLRKYTWQRDYSSTEYVHLTQTYSDHVVRSQEERAALTEAIGAAIDAAGGTLSARYTTLAIVALAPR
ncbi:MAG TPA: class I SAM-dependent methyltransferase [Jatrophihabitantaceae bacterium]|nr:class I SAM-dependent methyltransferase [Jatrophihabitantaceae bacterium]